MGEIINLANVVLLLGVIYLYLEHGLGYITALVFIALAVVSWGYHGYSKERKRLLDAEADYYEAKANWYNRRDTERKKRC